MNFITIRLVLVGTRKGFVVMYKILTVVIAFFECEHVNSTFFSRDSLLLILTIVSTTELNIHYLPHTRC